MNHKNRRASDAEPKPQTLTRATSKKKVTTFPVQQQLMLASPMISASTGALPTLNQVGVLQPALIRVETLAPHEFDTAAHTDRVFKKLESKLGATKKQQSRSKAKLETVTENITPLKQRSSAGGQPPSTTGA